LIRVDYFGSKKPGPDARPQWSKDIAHGRMFNPVDLDDGRHLVRLKNDAAPELATRAGGLTDGTTDLSAEQVIAFLDHHHDGRYAFAGHTHEQPLPGEHQHDDLYASIVHDHDERYPPIVHAHDGQYSPLGHNHSGVYQPVGSYADAVHDHDFLAGLAGDVGMAGNALRVLRVNATATALELADVEGGEGVPGGGEVGDMLVRAAGDGTAWASIIDHLATQVGVFGSLSTVYRNLLHLRYVGEEWVPQWSAVNMVLAGSGAGTTNNVAFWDGTGYLAGEPIGAFLSGKVSIVSGDATSITYLQRAGDGSVMWKKIGFTATGGVTNNRLAVWKVVNGASELQSSSYPENDEQYVAAVVSVFLNAANGDTLYNGPNGWARLPTTGKSRYMVMQLDANLRPSWDYLRAY
jgi:hypothetical protein